MLSVVDVASKFGIKILLFFVLYRFVRAANKLRL